MDIKEKIALRKKCNFILGNIISLSLSLNPELRYIQNLWVLNIIDVMEYREGTEVVDRFGEEPYNTIVRILPKIVELINTRLLEHLIITSKLHSINIITGLEELGLVIREDTFKIVPKESSMDIALY